MEQDTEGLAQNGPFNDAMDVKTSIFIIHGAETMLLVNQAPPILDPPPVQSPRPHPQPVSTINFMSQGSAPQVFSNSPLTAPSMATGTSDNATGVDATERTSEDVPAQWHCSIQNVNYEQGNRHHNISSSNNNRAYLYCKRFFW